MTSNINIDIVIISDAYNNDLKITTENAIKSLYESENELNFITYVVESSDVDYSHLNKNIHMVKPIKPFGYNKYLNLGIKEGNSEYVCLCNNDLIFYKGWATTLINEMNKDNKLLSVSPISYEPHLSEGLVLINGDKIYGYNNITNICGWAIFQKRQIYNIIGELDETFTFWYSDNDYGMTLKKYNLRHALVPKSRVDHIQSKTLNYKDKTEKEMLTIKQEEKMLKKWNK